MRAWLAVVLVTTAFAGCLADEAGPDDVFPEAGEEPEPRFPAPAGETITGLQPIDLIFDGSLRVTFTRVLLVPPLHGDLADPTDPTTDAFAYLEATLAGIYAWEPAVDLFLANHSQFAYLDDIAVEVEIFSGGTPSTLGYDFVIGYAETSGPAFRGVAIMGPGNPDQQMQATLNDAGLGDLVHFGHRYVLLSLFASAPRGGQDLPDFPEAHEVHGVTMHEFAHVWGLGHTTTWFGDIGPDLMNSPYPFVYGDGDPLGDGKERSEPLCISSLDLWGLAWLYRWLDNGTWERSTGNTSLPESIPYERYCSVHDDALARARAHLAAAGIERGKPIPGARSFGVDAAALGLVERAIGP
jgi:hypothetical protein